MAFKFPEVSSKFGAPMGRRNELPDGPAKLHLERVHFVDGDYDKGGAYWGGGSPLYVAWDENGTMIFVRARDRNQAKQEVLDTVSDDVTFHRIPNEGEHHG